LPSRSTWRRERIEQEEIFIMQISPSFPARAALSTLSVACVFASFAHAGGKEPHGGDVFLDVENGTIVTGLIDEKAMTIDVPVFVFAAEFGDGGTPTQTTNPGFDSLPATFPIGSRVGWNALDGINVWNGSGFIDAPGERFTISFTAALQVVVEDSAINGFDLAVQADGAWHRHLTFVISRADAQPPTPGTYLLELEMYSTARGVESSEPYWIVFNHEDDEANHDAAIEWVEDNLAPGGAGSCLGDVVSSATFQPPPDGVVDAADLAFLLGEWGANPGSPADFVSSATFAPPPDGIVDAADLAALLGAWGPCKP
jgi:hypothetical protein